uniref:Uncharacterized protein n=1 Tax=Meloidogyne enterolobii TaxID=390850 RepID=A0A6V7WR95_MELEN|nr:unnamed protein product [Meloidogyne enterolobii]
MKIFPFAYSNDSDQFEKLNNGPPYENDFKCNKDCIERVKGCMKKNGLELGWRY